MRLASLRLLPLLALVGCALDEDPGDDHADVYPASTFPLAAGAFRGPYEIACEGACDGIEFRIDGDAQGLDDLRNATFTGTKHLAGNLSFGQVQLTSCEVTPEDKRGRVYPLIASMTRGGNLFANGVRSMRGAPDGWIRVAVDPRGDDPKWKVLSSRTVGDTTYLAFRPCGVLTRAATLSVRQARPAPVFEATPAVGMKIPDEQLTEPGKVQIPIALAGEGRVSRVSLAGKVTHHRTSQLRGILRHGGFSAPVFFATDGTFGLTEDARPGASTSFDVLPVAGEWLLEITDELEDSYAGPATVDAVTLTVSALSVSRVASDEVVAFRAAGSVGVSEFLYEATVFVPALWTESLTKLASGRRFGLKVRVDGLPRDAVATFAYDVMVPDADRLVPLDDANPIKLPGMSRLAITSLTPIADPKFRVSIVQE
jgi:hypothetical protein